MFDDCGVKKKITLNRVKQAQKTFNTTQEYCNRRERLSSIALKQSGEFLSTGVDDLVDDLVEEY